jgi:hypothetical protein
MMIHLRSAIGKSDMTREWSRSMLKKTRPLTRPTLAVISPSSPESSNPDSSPWDEPYPKQGCSE